MGSNSVQAQGIVLFAIGLILLAGTFASGGNWLLIIATIVAFGLSVWRFLTCKGWEEGKGKSG
jgi:hypothetical protein